MTINKALEAEAALRSVAALVSVLLAVAACGTTARSTPEVQPRDSGPGGSFASMARQPTPVATSAIEGLGGYPMPGDQTIDQAPGKAPSDTYPAPLNADADAAPPQPPADGASVRPSAQASADAFRPPTRAPDTTSKPPPAVEPPGEAPPADEDERRGASPPTQDAGHRAPPAADGPAGPGQLPTLDPRAAVEPDDDGYYPAPPGIDFRYQVLALETSPHSDLLVPMQRELDQGDAAALAERVREPGGVALTGDRLATMPESHADSALAQTHLASFFQQGSQPLIQGYFEVPNSSGESSTCVDVLVAGWQGNVALPTPRLGSGGPRPPAAIPEGHATWRLCQEEEGKWALQTWAWDGASYHGAVADRQTDLFGPYRIVRPGLTSWPVEHAGGPDDQIRYGLDVPDGWFVAPGADGYIALDSCDWLAPGAAGSCDQAGDTLIEIAPHDSLEAQSMKLTVEDAKLGATETLFEERWQLDGGAPAIRLVLRVEPRGEQNLLLAVIGGHVIAATSWGDRDRFDSVAETLRPAESAPLP